MYPVNGPFCDNQFRSVLQLRQRDEAARFNTLTRNNTRCEARGFWPLSKKLQFRGSWTDFRPSRLHSKASLHFSSGILTRTSFILTILPDEHTSLCRQIRTKRASDRRWPTR